MPILQVTTDKADKVWSSPDGQRTIWKLTLLYGDQPVAAKTYSQTIATKGFSGEVESYEKPGRDGSETFVRQAPKENPGHGSTGGSSQRSGSGYTPKDEKAIQAMWAVGQAVQLYIGEFSGKAKPPEPLPMVEAYAEDLFAMVDRVKAPEQEEEGSETPDPVMTPEEVDKAAEEPIDLSKIDEVFGTGDKEDKE